MFYNCDFCRCRVMAGEFKKADLLRRAVPVTMLSFTQTSAVMSAR